MPFSNRCNTLTTSKGSVVLKSSRKKMHHLFARIDRKFHGKFYESRFHIKLQESFSFSLCLKEEFLTHGKSLTLGHLEGSQAT